MLPLRNKKNVSLQKKQKTYKRNNKTEANLAKKMNIFLITQISLKPFDITHTRQHTFCRYFLALSAFSFFTLQFICNLFRIVSNFARLPIIPHAHQVFQVFQIIQKHIFCRHVKFHYDSSFRYKVTELIKKKVNSNHCAMQ